MSCGLERPPIDLHRLATKLYPFPRSLTGAGVRQTLAALCEHIPLQIHEVPSGTPVLDWEVPLEWTIRGGAIRTLDGRSLIDFKDHNLHVVGYSTQVHRTVSRDELAAHVHTLPDQPELIPYRTGYFASDWGFCLPHRLWSQMTDAAYRVDIDSDLAPGSLTYGELIVPGASDDEVLISTHLCHPSLANDNLSGIAVATALALRQAARNSQLSYRFLFLPATIGAITWLARNNAQLARIRHGLVLTCVGDPGPIHYKQSRRGSSVDRAVEHVLEQVGAPHEILPFSPYGYDERQYCSPGFDLPVGCFTRGVHGAFPEYHTSADDLGFITADALDQSFGVLAAVLDLLDADRMFKRVDGRGEPQLGRRGLYRAIAGQKEAGGASQMDLLWLLNLADGRHTLLDMAERSKIPLARLQAAADLAIAADLVTEGL